MKLFLSLLLVVIVASSAFAQTTVLEGRLVNSLSGDPIRAATIVIDEAKREAVSGSDGTFRFDNLAPGTYHVWVRTAGYSPRRAEVTVPAAEEPVDVHVDPELHFQEVASVSAETRSQFDVVSANVRAGWPGSDETARDVHWRDAGESTGRRRAQLSGRLPTRPVIRGLGRGPRADSAGRAAHGRSVQAVCRPCGDGEPSCGAAHRSGARPGDAAVRVQCDWRPRERHHR